MRRRHNISLATLACIGTIYLVAQNRHDFGDAYEVGKHINGIEILPSDEFIVLHKEDAATVQGKDVQSQTVPGDVRSPRIESAVPATEVPGLVSELRLFFAEASLSSSTKSSVPEFETTYPFQQDLQLDLPTTVLRKYSGRKPHNHDPEGTKAYAYASFLATRNPSLRDPYFLAIHSLIYRLLWSPRIRSLRYPFVVFVAESVTEEQRALLAGVGALVRELSPLQWEPNVLGVQDRWKDLFAKLNMWKQTDFERILFLDADAFPLTNIDEMFDLAPIQDCLPEKLHLDDFLADGPVCEPYVFAGVPQDPFNATHPNINVGSIVFTPSSRMHARLVQNYVKTDKYDCAMAEQAFLNWQFDPEGAYPGTKLERQWGGFFPTEAEGGGKLKVVHEKIWVADSGWMKEEWERGWKEMIEFYRDVDFVKARDNDGVVAKAK
ncbi:nucleotide-diphospho-sugar transferase [Decorospora gaudefroyi]|uniref:Nucleotide-diphospho-sugar transferase n=1 Tax=Decorospora gaudefroyi TaxID=184978 RepID=A0A6A5JWZ1_9PLEO|nr:nucleotide-diphospho-sugar transferase [Decorospora gaudefroyi]